MAKQPVILSVKDIRKAYGKKEILKGITFDIYQNDSLAILGSNGAGKTTLVEIICQTKKASSGSVEFFFADKKIKEHIGIQFQEGNWPSGLSANDMIQFYRGVYPEVTDERVKELIETFEIESFIKTSLSRLSGGQKQRFNALLAVLHNPEFIILDELTTGLDIQLQYKILNYMKSLVRDHNHTILLVSHVPEEVEALVNRVIVLHDGKIFVDYRMDEIIAKYQSVRHMMDLYFSNKLESNVKGNESDVHTTAN